MTAAENKKKAYKNLDYVVRNFLVEKNQFSLHNYQRILQIAIRGYHHLNLHVLPSIKVAYLTINDNLTADLPADYMHYTKIGVSINGVFVTLGLNKDMVIPKGVNACGKSLVDTTLRSAEDSFDYWAYGYYYAPHFRNGRYVGEQYSAGGGFSRYGYYRIDEENHQIALSSISAGSELILEYKSNGLDCDGGALVPMAAVQPLIEWIYWRTEKADPMRKSVRSETQFRQEFIEEYALLQDYVNSFTYTEFLDSTYAQIKATPKR